MFEKEKALTIEYFQSRGWETTINIPAKVEVVEVIPGDSICCGDDRYKKDSPRAPRLFGATDGVAAHLNEAATLQDRYKKAVDLIENSGFTPGNHGDYHHGHLSGCGFRNAWIRGDFPWLDVLPLSFAWSVRFLHQIEHHLVPGQHRAEVLIINFEPESTLIQNGQAYANDFWYLLKLGFKMEEILRLSAHTGELLLSFEKRRLTII